MIEILVIIICRKGKSYMAIRVFLADDHMMVREGLKQLLELSDKIEVIGLSLIHI